MATAEKILIVGQKTLVNKLIHGTIQSYPSFRHSLIDILPSVEQALKELSILEFQMIIVDCDSLKLSPLEILIQLRAVKSKTPLILINQPGMEKTAISCLKHGADYYLIKGKKWEEELPVVMESILEDYRHRTRMSHRLNTLEEENRLLRSRAMLDDTTSFYGAEHFSTILARELKRATRYESKLACLLLEIQSVQKKGAPSESSMNALYEQMALLLRSVVRSCDIWARLNHQRFAAILPNTSAKQAEHAVRRIQSEIKTSPQLSQKKGSLHIRWGLADFNKDTVKDEGEFLALAESSMRAG